MLKILLIAVVLSSIALIWYRDRGAELLRPDA